MNCRTLLRRGFQRHETAETKGKRKQTVVFLSVRTVLALAPSSRLPRQHGIVGPWAPAPTVVQDRDRDEVISLPLGRKVSKLADLGRRLLQIQASSEHHFFDGGPGPKDMIGFMAKLPVPMGG